MRRLRQHKRSAGFSLLEAMIALSVAGLVLANVTMLLRSTTKVYGSGLATCALEAQASQAMDRIALALAGASRDSLVPACSAPLSNPEITYESSLGLQDGAVVWSDPERIALQAEKREVVWTQSPNSPEERSVVWGKEVSADAMDELPGNLADDNDNTFVDEPGLSFAVDGDTVIINLSLLRTSEAGTGIEHLLTTRIACRN